MNQQTLMAVPRAYPAPKASDELLWQEPGQAWLNDEPAHYRNVQGRADDDELCAPSLMHKNIEKMLSTTRFSWAASYADRQLPTKRRR